MTATSTPLARTATPPGRCPGGVVPVLQPGERQVHVPEHGSRRWVLSASLPHECLVMQDDASIPVSRRRNVGSNRVQACKVASPDKLFRLRQFSEHLNRFFGRPTVELRLTFTMQSSMMTKNALRAGATSKPAGARGRASVRVLATSRVDRCSKSEIMVAPSILSANFARLGEQVRAVYRVPSIVRRLLTRQLVLRHVTCPGVFFLLRLVAVCLHPVAMGLR